MIAERLAALPAWLKKTLLALCGVGLTAGLSVGYYHLLEAELAGYRGVKEHQLELNRQRDLRRRAIPRAPAIRERMLKEEFGGLADARDIRIEMRLVKVWHKWLTLAFGVVAAGVSFYLLYWRKKSRWRRVLLALVILAAASQALPLLLLPEDALHFIRRAGTPVILVAAAYLLVEAARDRLAARRPARATG
jgi:hypothetical protein